MHSFLTDNNGNKSSKRLLGASLLCVALIMAIVLFIGAILGYIKDPDTAISMMNTLCIAGSSLLGIGVFEPKRQNG